MSRSRCTHTHHTRTSSTSFTSWASSLYSISSIEEMYPTGIYFISFAYVLFRMKMPFAMSVYPGALYIYVCVCVLGRWCSNHSGEQMLTLSRAHKRKMRSQSHSRQLVETWKSFSKRKSIWCGVVVIHETENGSHAHEHDPTKSNQTEQTLTWGLHDAVPIRLQHTFRTFVFLVCAQRIWQR